MVIFSQVQSYQGLNSVFSEHFSVKYWSWRVQLFVPGTHCLGLLWASDPGPLFPFPSKHSKNILTLSLVLSSVTPIFLPLALTFLYSHSCISNALWDSSSKRSCCPLQLSTSKSQLFLSPVYSISIHPILLAALMGTEIRR